METKSHKSHWCWKWSPDRPSQGRARTEGGRGPNHCFPPSAQPTGWGISARPRTCALRLPCQLGVLGCTARSSPPVGGSISHDVRTFPRPSSQLHITHSDRPHRLPAGSPHTWAVSRPWVINNSREGCLPAVGFSRSHVISSAAAPGVESPGHKPDLLMPLTTQLVSESRTHLRQRRLRILARAGTFPQSGGTCLMWRSGVKLSAMGGRAVPAFGP